MSPELTPPADKLGIAPYQSQEGEPYMSGSESHFRNILNSWRRDLMEEVDRTVDHMKVDRCIARTRTTVHRRSRIWVWSCGPANANANCSARSTRH